MITDFLLKSFIAILRFIASPMMVWPDAALDPSYASAAAIVVADFREVAYIFPLVYYALRGGFEAMVAFEFLYGLYKVIMWGIKKIPFIN